MAGTCKYMVGVKRGKSVQQSEDMSKSQDTALAIEQARKWIEECTDTSQQDISFRELVKDGTLLCELIQRVQPGLIKKINRNRTPFGGRENLSFFLDACRKLGLKGSQLFDPEDLQGSQGPSSFRSELRCNSSRGRRDENERKLRNVAVTIYWLGKKLNQLPGYSGPELDLTAFQNLVGNLRRRSYSAAGRLSNSSSVNSSANSTPTKPPYGSQSSSSNSGSIASPSSSKTSVDDITPVSPDHTPATTVVNIDIHDTPRNTSTTTSTSNTRQHTAVKSFSLPVDVEAVPPCSPKPAESLQEEEEITDKENNPVSPATPVKQAKSPSSSQARTQETDQAKIQDTIQIQADPQDTIQIQANPQHNHQAKPLNGKQAELKNNTEAISQPVVQCNHLTANHSNAHVRQPSADLKYTIADLNILDATAFDLEVTSDLPTDHKVAKFEGLSSPEEALPVNPSLKGKVFCVDTADCSEEMAGILPNGHAMTHKKNHGLPNGDISTLGRLLSKELDVSVRLDTGEKRFGFSVIGGADEGFPARVESIAAGSAASRVDLRPGDELVAMDNMPLSTIEHAAVIKMIQKASQSGRVLLRIKRITTKEPSVDIGPSVVVMTNGETSDDDDHKQNGDHKQDGDKLNNGFVRVESKAVPTPQHPTKVIYPPDVIHLQRHLELVSDSYSDDNSTRAELGSNADERSISSDESDSQQPDSSSEVLRDEAPSVSNEQVPSIDTDTNEIPSTPVEQVPSNAMEHTLTEQALTINTEQTHSEEISTSNGDSVTSPVQGVVMLQSSLNVSSTMSVVRPRSAPQSKLHKVLPADSSKCFTTQDTPVCNIDRHQSQKNVVEVKHVKKDMHKYSSLPAGGKQISLMSMESSSKQFTLLNSFKDSREAIDEIWKSVTLGDSEPISPTDVIVDVPTSPVELQAAVSMSSSLAVNATEGDPSSPTMNGHVRDDENDGNVEGSSMLQLIREVSAKVGKEEDAEDYKALERIIQSNNFKNVMEMTTIMRQLVDGDPPAPRPLDKHAILTALMLRKRVRENGAPDRTMLDLRALLQDADIQALLFCHDRVATRDLCVPETESVPQSYHNATDTASAYSQDTDVSNEGALVTTIDPVLRSSTINLDAWDRRDQATIVYIKKTNKPLGASIYKQGDAIFVGHLLKGCDAEQSGVLHEGDELLEINGIPLEGKTIDQMVTLMSAIGGTQLALTIIPGSKGGDNALLEPIYVRAYFDYNPLEDGYIPCRDLGLAFSRGDILEIINHDDPNWWQARRVDHTDTESQPGLIPAKHMQERREALRISHPGGNFYQRQRRKGLLYKMKKKKKVFYSQTVGTEGLSVGDEVLTYEEVVRLPPEERLKRPIVLIGAPGVGKSTLKDMLISRHSGQFADCVPFTSRPMKPNEVSGQDYHFISRDQIEKEISANKFVEYKEVKGNYYGIHMASVSNVLLAGKSPVLDLQHPQSLKLLRNRNLMPYVIFVAAPSIEQLYHTRKPSLMSEKNTKKSRRGSEGDAVMGDELEQLFWTSQQIEIHYAPYFDSTVVNDDLNVCFDLLIEVVQKIEQEPQWVPSSWVQPNVASWVLLDPPSAGNR